LLTGTVVEREQRPRRLLIPREPAELGRHIVRHGLEAGDGATLASRDHEHDSVLDHVEVTAVTDMNSLRPQVVR
jgi:hypothetical protein